MLHRPADASIGARAQARRGRRHRAAAPVVLVALLVAAVLGVAFPSLASAATPSPWSAPFRPWSDGAAVNDLSAAEPALVAAAGAAGHVGISLSGGLTWSQRSPAAQGFDADLNGIAFADISRGVVVGAQGAILVTSDGGSTWRLPAFSGSPPSADLHDVALAGTRFLAVGDRGTAVQSTDFGESWQVVKWPTGADLRHVALAEDGTIVAGAADGSLLVRRDGDWRKSDASAPITSVAVSDVPSWGDGTPDVLASTGWEIIGSDDGSSFTALLRSVYAAVPPWPTVAWFGVPDTDFLAAGPAGGASFYSLASSTLTEGVTRLGDARTAAVPGTQSVAFVLDADGRIARTLSAGRTAGTITRSATRITAGREVTLTSTVRIAAPGLLTLEHRAVGGSWKPAGALSWTSADWERVAVLGFRPTLSNDFRFTFSYGGDATVVSGTQRVVVRPRLTPDKLRITVRRGQAYRFKGTVFPRLRGEKVKFYTDRGGKWRRVRIGGVVKLQKGTRWVSRLFGTPVRETYRLRARIDSTARHGAAWSPVVTVRVR